MRNTPNFGLNVWDSLMDRFNHDELAANWDLIDAHDHSGGVKGLQIPAAGLVDGAVTAAKVNDALKPSAGATDTAETLRRLGLSAGTAMPGNAVITRTQLETLVQQALFSAGDIKPTTASSAATGWLICDGSAVSRTTYAALWNAIRNGHAGTLADPAPYGNGDGSTTFNLPDFKGRVLVGSDATGVYLPNSNRLLGQWGGNERVNLTTAQLPLHTHAFGIALLQDEAQAASAGGALGYAPGAAGVSRTSGTAGTGSGVPVTILQPYQVVNWLIKT